MKRWARALTLVTSWYWLIMGALVTVLLTAVLPVTMRTALAQMKQSGPNAPSPEMSTAVMAVMLTVLIIFMAFFLVAVPIDRKSTRLNSSHLGISYAVFCLKKKNT